MAQYAFGKLQWHSSKPGCQHRNCSLTTSGHAVCSIMLTLSSGHSRLWVAPVAHVMSTPVLEFPPSTLHVPTQLSGSEQYVTEVHVASGVMLSGQYLCSEPEPSSARQSASSWLCGLIRWQNGSAAFYKSLHEHGTRHYKQQFALHCGSTLTANKQICCRATAPHLLQT